MNAEKAAIRKPARRKSISVAALRKDLADLREFVSTAIFEVEQHGIKSMEVVLTCIDDIEQRIQEGGLR